jgi:cytosine/adenosine deaminase-related metal-dependent hydrolase
MKRLTAQYIITNTGPALKRAVLNVEDDGTVISVEDTGGDLKEIHSTEFHNGIIIPGFVNCHCHLELSHLKNTTSRGKGLSGFIEQVRGARDLSKDYILASALTADEIMQREGIVLCADTCNTSDSFSIKRESRISYLNLLEVFGLDPEKALKRMDEILLVAKTAEKLGLKYSFIPHSAYSMSAALFRLLLEESRNNKVTSIHFMESEEEAVFLKTQSGSLMSSYLRSGLLPPKLETVNNHVEAILNEITPSGNLILVHNTFADSITIRNVKKRENLYWCLCPNSNLYIENRVPPLDLFLEENCDIVIGTDSLASNTGLSILEELKTLQFSFPGISIPDLIRWATFNGAKALGEEENFGSIEAGKKPGLLLLQNVDLLNMKLLPDSFVTKLI